MMNLSSGHATLNSRNKLCPNETYNWYIGIFLIFYTVGSSTVLFLISSLSIKAVIEQMRQTYPTIGPSRSKLYTCLGFSRYLNFLSTLKEEKDKKQHELQRPVTSSDL